MNILHLVLLMVINLMDFLMIYLLGNKLVNEEKVVFTKKSGRNMISFGLIYGILIGGIAYTVLYNNVDLYIFRIITTIALIFVSKLVSKESFLNAFLLYTIIFFIILFIQMPLNILLLSLSLEGFHISITGQIVSLIIIILLCLKVPIHYFYGLVQKNVLLKLILYTTMCIGSILLFSANYTYSISSVFFFLILIVLTMIGLGLVLVRISFYTNVVSKNLHDTSNLINGIHLTAHSTADINEIRKNLDACIELLQLQNSVLDVFEINQEKENILHFIQQKKEKQLKSIDIVTQITYIDAHQKVPLSIVIYMLGTLLDNTIEYVQQHQIKNKPIVVELTVMDDTVKIHVSNPYEKEVTDEFRKVFQQGRSNKLSHKGGRDGRGYGLSNLKSIVRKYGGIIYYGSEYHLEYEYTYLTISIEISCYSSYKSQVLVKSTSYGNKTLFLVKMK